VEKKIFFKKFQSFWQERFDLTSKIHFYTGLNIKSLLIECLSIYKIESQILVLYYTFLHIMQFQRWNK